MSASKPATASLHIAASDSAERAVLGAILADSDCFRRVVPMLAPEDFYNEAHCVVFRAFTHLAAEHRAIDLLTATDQLERSGKLTAAGGAAYVGSLADGLPDPANVEHYAAIVRERAVKRRVLFTAQELMAAAGSDSGELSALGSIVDGLANTIRHANTDGQGVKVYTTKEFLTLRRSARAWLFEPWLRTKDVSMIYSARGCGKTRLALGVSVAVASGAAFLHGHAEKPQTVLYVDGELPVEALQAILSMTIKALDADPGDHLRILSADSIPAGLSSLTEEAGQRVVESLCEDTALVVLDSISTLCRSGEENAAESWQPVQDFLLRLRRRGVAVLLLHHAGKTGLQRGTSKREDILDVVLRLTHPPGYNASEGCRFVAEFEKSRGLVGEAVESFEVQLWDRPEGPVWTVKNSDVAIFERVIELTREGLSQSDIAREVGRDKSRVSRLIAKAKREGKL